MNIEWTELPPLPPLAQESVQPGLAGPFAGLHGNTLIVAGGANFRDTMPWHGGKKRYHNDIYLLQLQSEGETWKTFHGTGGLPHRVAYGASASVRAGVVCMGGETAEGLTDEVFIISVAGDKPIITPLPKLPVALSGAAASSAGSVVFVAGGMTPDGSSQAMWSLDTEEISTGWKRLADIPLPLINSVMVASAEENGDLWMLGGRTRGAEDDFSEIRSEIFRYSIAGDNWLKMGDLSDGHDTVRLAAGTGSVVGAGYIVLFGGNDGSVFCKVEKLLSEMAWESDTARLARLRKEYISLQESHPGFCRDVILFDLEKGESFKAGEIPGDAQVTTFAVDTPWGIIIPSGETKPGVRTPVIRMAKFK